MSCVSPPALATAAIPATGKLDSLVRSAGAAMYRAKANGRNGGDVWELDVKTVNPGPGEPVGPSRSQDV